MSMSGGYGCQSGGASRPPTLRDAAALAGVDTSTVSKVLKGDGISVRPETRLRIMEAVATLGYRPNAAARGLRLQRSGAFGMLLPDITNPVYASIVRGAVRRAEGLGYSLLLAEIPFEAAEDGYRRLVQEKRIDGLLVATARRTGRMAGQLSRDGVPHVFVNRRVGGPAPSVTVDDEAGAAVAAAAMAKLGHHRLAVVAGPNDIDTAHRRLQGFQAEVARLGLPDPMVRRGAFTAGGGYEAMHRLLSSRARPTAVFVSNFVASIGAMRATADAGLRIPEDLSLVSFDDAEIAEYLSPALTAVRMPFEEMGALAVEVLALLIEGNGRGGAVVTTPPKLEMRESLGVPGP